MPPVLPSSTMMASSTLEEAAPARAAAGAPLLLLHPLVVTAAAGGGTPAESATGSPSLLVLPPLRPAAAVVAGGGQIRRPTPADPPSCPLPSLVAAVARSRLRVCRRCPSLMAASDRPPAQDCRTSSPVAALPLRPLLRSFPTVEALERVYAECPKPRFSRRQQLLCELSILANIEPKQKIKVWFPKQKVSKSMQGYTIKLVCLLCVWL
uniref:Homeobox domain-containing protein n=1 Tax=Oryza nivara TaxID=4536 RepID=A0A0E0GUA9_ORYNI